MNKQGLIAVIFALTFGVLAVASQGNGTAPEAPPEVDQERFAQGQELFEANCAVCHQSSGEGNPPTFPALAGNENLQDVSLIVRTIHEGRGAMPPFPQFGGEEISALATYIRNAWENDFGGVSAEEAAGQLAAIGDREKTADLVSIWDGVYTQEQAERGDTVYTGSCSVCHGYIWIWKSDRTVRQALSRPNPHSMLVSDPTLGPELSGEPFLREWDGRTVGSLFSFTRSTMPLDNPGALTDQQYIDIIAFLFATSDVPIGDEELPPDPDVLNDIVIEPEPAQ